MAKDVGNKKAKRDIFLKTQPDVRGLKKKDFGKRGVGFILSKVWAGTLWATEEFNAIEGM